LLQAGLKIITNLYVHFPFCRRKCSYCALHSRVGATAAERTDYVRSLVARLRSAGFEPGGLKTVYFGGGSPALCDLPPLFATLAPLLAPGAEFTVELHPLDVTDGLLSTLRTGGVNRISMGVQSLDDAVLADMGRGYTADEAEKAFGSVREVFDSAGIDLIVGYPSVGDGHQAHRNGPLKGLERLKDWGLRHCSVYSLILEERSILGQRLRTRPVERERLPSDDETLDTLSGVARFLLGLGLERYEISNYAMPGFECRHNLAVWRGEDYLGLGEGACGRIGLVRTVGTKVGVEESTVTAAEDATERRIFRLRTREGLDAEGRPDWIESLSRFVNEGLLTHDNEVYRLTARGTEVCDAILAELV